MTEKIAACGETDVFVTAFERRMMRAGQGRHISCSVLELERAPDTERLRAGLAETLRRHAMVVARPARPWPFTRRWFVRSARAARVVPLGLWREDGTGDGIFSEPSAAKPDAADVIGFLLNDAGDSFEKPLLCNIRLDVIARRDGTAWAVLSWRHSVLDGVGAEWLLREIACLADDPAAESRAVSVVPPASSRRGSLRERWEATRPMLNHLMAILQTGIRSLAGTERRASRARFECVTLDARRSALVTARAAKVCGPLINTPYFLACALRAHDAVWRGFRGGPPDAYAVALPVQERPRGKAGPIFRNNVSVLFLKAGADEVADPDPDALTAALLRRQQSAMRAKLLESFAEMQRWMMMLPGPLYTLFLNFQMKGETTAFHHSNTGTFAAGLEEFGGAAIANAWHVPALYAPPGTGVFVSDKGGRMTVTVSWREGVLTPAEAALLRDAFLESLTGESFSGAPLPEDGSRVPDC